MEEALKQVFVPIVATPGGEKTQLGVFSTEQDAWDVMRAFLAKAGATDVVSGSIVAWEIDYDQEKARCYFPRCGAWIEQNAYDPSRWDCGWPAANWNKRAEDYEQAYKGLVAMRAQSTSAGMTGRMASREAWLDEKDRERRTIQQKKFDAMSDEMTE